MIALAEKYNRYGDRCKYLLNRSANLSLLDSNRFDFVYSNLVLQHMEPVYAKKYIEEFLRVMAPGGIVLFQLPSKRLDRMPVSRTREATFRNAVKAVLPESFLTRYRAARKLIRSIAERRENGLTDAPTMEMYGIERAEVESFLGKIGARILDIREDSGAGSNWLGFRYCVTK